MKKRTDQELNMIEAFAPFGENQYQSDMNVRRALHDNGIQWAIEALREKAVAAITCSERAVNCEADARYLESLLNSKEE